jgi:asparagine synthetase B (glutamine-hydrolysing)
MCGIAGIFAYNSGSIVEEKELLACREAMVARGPDGSGAWISAVLAAVLPKGDGTGYRWCYKHCFSPVVGAHHVLVASKLVDSKPTAYRNA